MHSTNNAAQDAAVDFANAIVPIWQAELGPELLGIYLLGSLAHGGFSARYSDIDVAVITERGLSTQALERVRGRAIALSTDWGSKLSVFWTDRHFGVGRFPPLDRVDYLDHAVTLVERRRALPARPSLEDIRLYLAETPFTSWTALARRFASAETLDPKDRKAFLRTFLYPARFCYSWMTGQIGSNDEAVAFLRKVCPSLLDLSLVASALECRRAGVDPDPLFSARTSLPAQVSACVALLSQQT